MSNYTIEVTLENLICRDTESILYPDKFALAGAVFTDSDSAGVVFPLMHISSGGKRELQTLIFSGVSDVAKVGLVLQAWDIDENESWIENKDGIVTAATAIAQGVKLVPKYGTILGLVLDGVNEVVPRVVDQFVEWDKNDQLLSYSSWVDLPVQGAFVPSTKNFSIDFKREDWLDYSGYDYSLEISVRSAWTPSFGDIKKPPSSSKSAMKDFRHRADIAAKEEEFAGAFPNFYRAKYGENIVGGTIFLRSNASEWRDISLHQLGNPSLEDFAARMRATQDYAIQQGFAGGFPNFYHAKKYRYQGGFGWDSQFEPVTVCGTVLIGYSSATWRDVPLVELGNPPLDDIGARFKATHDYAVKNGFLGGFPNFYHADYGNGIVCGTLLIEKSAGEWRDVFLYRVPDVR